MRKLRCRRLDLNSAFRDHRGFCSSSRPLRRGMTPKACYRLRSRGCVLRGGSGGGGVGGAAHCTLRGSAGVDGDTVTRAYCFCSPKQTTHLPPAMACLQFDRDRSQFGLRQALLTLSAGPAELQSAASLASRPRCVTTVPRRVLSMNREASLSRTVRPAGIHMSAPPQRWL